MNKVYVLSIRGKPLMPCSPTKARHLLKEKKVKIVNYEPFTIQLLFKCDNKTQPLTLGIDSGSENIGFSVVSDSKELYSSEVKLRNDIVELISQRSQLRRTRRSRKTRYRKSRFLNRKIPKGWLPPSILNKINSHLQQIKKINDILPIKKTIIEVASFDIEKIKNPNIQGKEYQEGEQLGFWNVREYVLWRDNHKCQSGQKCKDPILVVHHLESRKTGGNSPNNLLTLCDTCHKNYHSGKIELKQKRGQSFRGESYMNTMRWKLFEQLKEKYPNVSLTYGYITKHTRINNNLEKSHRVDALCVTGNPQVERLDSYYQIKQVRKYQRSLHEVTFRKGRNGVRQNKNVKSVFRKGNLWFKWDKVKFGNEIGFITGFDSVGNRVYVRDIEYNTLKDSPKNKLVNPFKLKLINRNNNWITMTVTSPL